MIRPLRCAHRAFFPPFSLGLALLLSAALRSRRAAPVDVDLAEELVAPSERALRSLGAALSPPRDGSAPDLLVYWSAAAPEPGRAPADLELPPDARLVGALAPQASLPAPPIGTATIVFSLGHGEILSWSWPEDGKDGR
jgi:hypothetical protein